jgi:hypothetical protein
MALQTQDAATGAAVNALSRGGGIIPAGDWAAVYNEADASLTAINDAVTYNVPAGAQTIVIDVRGTAVLTVVPEGTVDGANWFSLQGFSINGALLASFSAFPAIGRISVIGLTAVRLRCSAFTSGSVAAVARFSIQAFHALSATNTVDTELITPIVSGDALSNPTAQPAIVYMHDFSGATWERYRFNESRALYASAARVAAPALVDQTTFGGKALIIGINATVMSGLGVSFILEGKDPTSLNYYTIDTVAAITTASYVRLIVDPRQPSAALTGGVQVKQHALPRTWRVRPVHGDATSVTYSVSADMVG